MSAPHPDEAAYIQAHGVPGRRTRGAAKVYFVVADDVMPDITYTPEAVRGCLLHLHDMREAVYGSLHGFDDNPTHANACEAFRCILMDLDKAVKALPEPLRKAIYWRYDKALTEREAAQRLGVSQRALHKQVLKAELLISKFLEIGTQNPPNSTLTYMEGQK